jgi:hypothetical protein
MHEEELREYAENLALHLVADQFMIKDKLKDFPRNSMLEMIDTAPEELKEELEEDADLFEELVISYFFRRLEYMKHEGFLWKKNDTYSIISDQEQDKILKQLAK